MTASVVSVVITTFNTAAYLPETLDSVLAQSHPHVEVIVVDDGSTDDTVDRARAYGDRITLVERAHEGLGPARNAGLERASGDFIAFLDSDDVWEPHALATQLAVARACPESGLIVSDGVEFSGDVVLRPHLLGPRILERIGTEAGDRLTGWLYPDLLRHPIVACPGQTLVPRLVADEIGPVCTEPIGATDYEYYLRIARSYPITFHAASLVKWRYRSESMSGPRETRALRGVAQSLRVYELELRACAPEYRAELRAAMARHARHGVLTAAHARARYGAEPDPDDLATAYRFVHWGPDVTATRVALALPSPLDRLTLRAAIAARRAARRTRRASP
jgi:glycosyltransferase involved in cell wall biosynthesis